MGHKGSQKVETFLYYIYLITISIKKISVEKTKWNVALFHLEVRLNLWTEKGYILFSFSEQRPEGYRKGIMKVKTFKGTKYYF